MAEAERLIYSSCIRNCAEHVFLALQGAVTLRFFVKR